MNLQLHGLVIRLQGHVDPRVAAVLTHFGAEPTDATPNVWLAVHEGVATPVPAAPVCARHLDVVLRRDDRGLHMHCPAGSGVVLGDRVDLYVEDEVPVHLLTCALFHVLRRFDVHPLHAACVVDPTNAWLIAGPSGAGKSTLVRALVEQGLALVSDDSVLLADRAQGVAALALRRGLFLRPSEVALPPGAHWRPCPLIESVKQELVLPRTERQHQCTPTALLLPQVVDRPRSELIPARRDEVLHRLVIESRLVEMDRHEAEAHMAPLLRLTTLPAWHAHLGRDVLEHPEEVRELLASMPAAHSTVPSMDWSAATDPEPHADPSAPIVASLGDEALVIDPCTRESWFLDARSAHIIALASQDAARAAAWVAQNEDVGPAEAIRRVQSCLDAIAPVPEETR